MSEQTTRLTKFLHKLEDIWVSFNLLICIVLGISTGVMSYFDWIQKLDQNSSNIITFASIVIGVMGVFLGVLASLQDSPTFLRLRQIAPEINKKIYTNLRSQIYYALIVVICSIIINSLPNIQNKIVLSIVDGIWFVFIWLMTLGCFYSVKLITDLIAKSLNNHSRNTRS